MSDETVVETDGVTVSKFFNAEDFPVPAVAFEVSSSLDEAVEFAIVDEIPDKFGIDQIGFHPEYGSEHWTASGDGVVRFEREMAAGESFTTVYGVRMEEGQDETPFLSAPAVEVAGDDIDDVVPPESTSVVRELASGERDTVPGLEDDAIEADLDTDDGISASEARGDSEGEQSEPTGVEALQGDDAEILGSAEEKLGVSTDDDSESAQSDAGNADADTPAEPGISENESDEAATSEAESSSVDTEDSVTVDDTEPITDSESVTDNESVTDTDSVTSTESVTSTDSVTTDSVTDTEPVDSQKDAGTNPAPVSFDASDIVGALADAVREDRVSDDDLETLREALGGVPSSTQAEIEHVQSRVSELEAYTDALKAFIDENGTAKDVLADFEADVDALEGDVAAIQADVGSVETRVADADEERSELRDRLDEFDGDLGAIDDLRENVERLSGDLDALDERVAGTEDLSMDVDALENDVADIEDDIETMEEWRDQLSDVFGA